MPFPHRRPSYQLSHEISAEGKWPAYQLSHEISRKGKMDSIATFEKNFAKDGLTPNTSRTSSADAEGIVSAHRQVVLVDHDVARVVGVDQERWHHIRACSRSRSRAEEDEVLERVAAQQAGRCRVRCETLWTMRSRLWMLWMVC